MFKRDFTHFSEMFRRRNLFPLFSKKKKIETEQAADSTRTESK